MNEFGYFPPVDGLLTLGQPTPSGSTDWPDHLPMGFAAEHVPELVRMATDDRLNELYSDRVEVWAPIHAMRVLGQLRAASTAEQLLAYLGSRPKDDIDDWTMEELPIVLALFGESVIPQLVKFLGRSELDSYVRNMGAHALVELARRSPETRPQCVAALAEQLEKFAGQDSYLNGFLVGDLCDLGAVETLPLIERAYLADAVDQFMVGDYEDVQVEMGVKPQRETPRPNHHGWISQDRLTFGMTADERRQVAQQRKKQRKAEAKAKARLKQKTKQSQQSRQRR